MGDFIPTPEQRYVLEELLPAGKSALVVSGPGTGKSRTAIEIARRKVESLQETRQQQILFLSFSNAAIDRLTATAGIHFTPRERRLLRFMTYHSCAADTLRHYGRFVGLPPTVHIADKLEERLVCVESGWSEDGETRLGLYQLARTKGLLTFDMLIPLADRLLRSSSVLHAAISRRYPLIVVDEFQDTSEAQWKFLQLLGYRSQVIVFADPNQIIYAGMHAATEKRLHEFEEWKGVIATPFSTANFRCSDGCILDFANCLLTGTPFRATSGTSLEIVDAGFRTRLRGLLAVIWRAIREQYGTGETVGVLAPSNKLVEKIAVDLRNPPSDSPIPFPVYTQMARDEAAYDAVILTMAALRDFARAPSELTAKKAAVALLVLNTHWNSRVKVKSGQIEVLSKDLADQMEACSTRLGIFIHGLRMEQNLSEQIPGLVECLREIRYFSVAASRISAHGRLCAEKITIDDPQMSLFDSFRSTRTPKGLTGYDAWKGKTNVLTYHKSKGREFDFVVLVVDPRGESTKVTLEEKRRLYYVCATRAKKWIGIVHFGRDKGAVLGPVIG